MRIVMIAALVAAPLVAAAGAPAQAAERPGEDAAQQGNASAGARVRDEVERSLDDPESTESRIGMAESHRAEDARQDEPRKKRKSTGDKVLTGAAVVLGIGALAVGGLLVAIFVN